MIHADNVCLLVVPDMKLSPNVGSDRSWVWNATADVSEGEPEAATLAIRFANAESKFDALRKVFVSMLTSVFRRQPLQGGFRQGSGGEREDHYGSAVKKKKRKNKN